MPDQDTKKSKTILVVEDHQLNMKLWNDILEAQGYLLLKTAFGVEAVEIARNRQPDLILLDIQLPDISGFEVVRRLKANELMWQSLSVQATQAMAQQGGTLDRLQQRLNEAKASGAKYEEVSYVGGYNLKSGSEYFFYVVSRRGSLDRMSAY